MHTCLSSGGWSWEGDICRIQISGPSFLYLKMILGVEREEQISGKSSYFLYPWDSCSQIVNILCVVNLQIFTGHLCVSWRASQVVPVVKQPTGQCRRCKRRRLNPCVREIPWRKKWPSFPVKRFVLTIIFIYLFIQARFTGASAAVGGARINKSFPHTTVLKLWKNHI